MNLKLTTRLAVVALGGLLATNALAQNLISNPGFETPSQGTGYTGYTTGSTNITGWTVDTNLPDGATLFSVGACSTYGVANDGSQILQLCGAPSYTTGGGVHQTITTVSNQTYIISIAVAYRTAASSGNFSFGGQNHALSASTTSYVTNTWTVTATNTSPVIDITGSTSSSANQLLIDNVSVTPALDPGIAIQPASQTVQPGQTATFSVTATGTSPFSYQWQATNSATGGFTNLVNGGQIAGAKTNVLTISNASTNNLQFYQVIVTNVNGSITSSIVSLAVNTYELIDVDIKAGVAGTQTGAAVLGGSGDVWNGVSTSTGTIVDSTGTTLSGVGYSLPSHWIFNNNTGGVATMDAATTNLMQDVVAGYAAAGYPTTTLSLTGLNAYINSAFTLVVYAAIGDANQGATLTLAGASGGNTASTLLTTGASRSLTNTPPNGGLGVAYQTFTGTLTNGTLSITASANISAFYGINGFQLQLAPTQPPIITSQPVSATNYTGSNVTFSVTAVGSSTIGYQWQANGGTGFTNVAGATSASLTITGITSANAGAYQVVVTNAGGSVTSSVANLTVFTIPVAGSSFTLGVTLGVPQTVQIIGGKYAPSNADSLPLTISSVTGQTNGTVSTDGTNITYTATNTAVGATNDSFTYTVSDGYGGTASQTVSVTISPAVQGFNNVSAQLIGGNAVLTYLGIPGFNYALDWTHSLAQPIVWTPVLTNPAAANGYLIFTNTPSGPGTNDFYRTRYVP